MARPAAGAAHEEHRRRGRPPQYERELLSELWRLLETDSSLRPREAARRVVGRHGGGGGSPENRSRHLLRLAERALHQPGAVDLLALFLWGRVTREGQRIRRRRRERDQLRAAKIAAASRRWGALYWAWCELNPLGPPNAHNDAESVQGFLASLDWCLQYKRDLNR